MFGLPEKFRLTVLVEGTPIGVRICPHKTNPALVVLKSGSVEALQAFCQLGGIQPGKTWTGSHAIMMALDEAVVLASMGEVTKKVLTMAREMENPSTAPETLPPQLQLKLLAGGKGEGGEPAPEA